MDNELFDALNSLRDQMIIHRGEEEIKVLQTPVEFITNSFPEVKQEEKKWVKTFRGQFQLELHQIREGRYVPFGLAARELIDAIFTKVYRNVKNNLADPYTIEWKNISSMVKEVKHLPRETKVSSYQRKTMFEALMNLSGTVIDIKTTAKHSETNEEYSFSGLTPIIQQLGVPSSCQRELESSEELTDGTIYLRVADPIYNALCKRMVPTKLRNIKLAGESCTRRDLIQYICNQAKRIETCGLQYLAFDFEVLRGVCGHSPDMPNKQFNNSIFRAIDELSKNHFEEYGFELCAKVISDANKRNSNSLIITRAEPEFLDNC